MKYHSFMRDFHLLPLSWTRNIALLENEMFGNDAEKKGFESSKVEGFLDNLSRESFMLREKLSFLKYECEKNYFLIW